MLMMKKEKEEERILKEECCAREHTHTHASLRSHFGTSHFDSRTPALLRSRLVHHGAQGEETGETYKKRPGRTTRKGTTLCSARRMGMAQGGKGEGGSRDHKAGASPNE